jgi:hypothetical protein
LRGWLSIELSVGGDAFGLGLVDGVDECGRVNPGFDGGLVTAQLGFGVGESAAGVFTLGVGEGAALRVEESLDCPGAVCGVEEGCDPVVERCADGGFADVYGGWVLR